MAGAMRKMGIYLGLVEEEDARAYGRYDARQADQQDRYDDGRYDDRYDEGRYDDRRPGRYEGRYDDRPADRAADRYAPEPRGEAAYGGFDSMAGDPAYDDRFDGRRLEDRRFDDDRADDRRFDDRRFDDDRAEPRAADAEPALPRRAGATRLGLATPAPSASSGPVPAGGEARVPAAGTPGARLGAVGGTVGAGGPLPGSGAAAGLAAREPVAAEPAPAPVPQPYRITTLSPKTYNEARAIGEAFREGSPVIMNLTELDHADARRLVDFAAGLIFGLRGNIEPVTAKVFLLSPRDVDVTAEDKARIREGGFFAQS